MSKKKFDVVGRIIDYESGEASDRETLELFAYLIQTGQAWTLQGHYGRTAAAFIERGLITKDGSINYELIDGLGW